MNYKRHYELLIDKAKNRTLDGYKERHHIIPKSFGGTDDKENLVDLTAREHFIAHLLLVYIHPESYSMIKALHMMTVVSSYHERSMNRLYSMLREKFSKAQSFNQSGEKNSQFGTQWIHNLELKISKKISKDEEIPEGWIKGRVINFSDKIQKICMCGNFTSNGKFCSKECRYKYQKRSSGGWKHTEETKRKMRENSDHNKGEYNPMYGAKYMFNDELRICKRFKPEEFEKDYRLQVLGAIHCIQACLPRLKNSGHASIVLFSTVAVKTGFSFHSIVSSSKGATIL